MWIHGFASHKGRHPLYEVWLSMVARCTNPKKKSWKDYGGRGIKVCRRWREFQNFLEDMQSGYERGLTIERKNNDGDYCPENCVWLPKSKQNLNKTTSRKLTFMGETLNVTLWAIRFNIRRATITKRIGRGWAIERAITTPAKPLNA